MRKGGKETARGMVASHAPLLETWLTTLACELTGNQTCNSGFADWHSILVFILVFIF